MLRWLSSRSSRRESIGRKNTLRFLAPENASLAQGLLQIVLDQAHVEIFSPGGGGIALMLLERWQIDILADFGVCFEKKFSVSMPPQQNEFGELSCFQPEYISIVKEHADLTHERFDRFTLNNDNGDILSDWLNLEDECTNAESQPSQSI